MAVKFAHCAQCGKPKTEKLSATHKFFRQINFELNSLKTLISRDFCDKVVAVKLRNFHTVGVTLWKNEKFSFTEKNFVKSTRYLVISLAKPLLSRNFCEKNVRENFRNFHCGCGKYGNLLSRFIGKNFVKIKSLLKRNYYLKS